MEWKLELKNEIVNLSSFKEGSSSCLCTMTLIGQEKETRRCGRKWRKLWSEFNQRCNIRQKGSIRMLVISGIWLWWKRIHVNKPNVNGTEFMRSWWWHLLKAGIIFFKPPVVKIPFNWFFARLFQSIRSVSTEQSQIYATKEIQIVPKVWSVNLQWYRLRVPTQSSTLSAEGNLLQDYFMKFAELPEDQKFSKFCKDAGFLKMIEKGQFFITIEEGSEVMQTACREYTISKPHNIPTKRTRLDVTLHPHEGRCCTKSWSNQFLKIEQFHGFVLWMVSTNATETSE